MEKTPAILPYHPIGQALKETFGGRIVKLSLESGLTCPNRDGALGIGGCSFCSAAGSGELSGQIPEQIALLAKKWPDAAGYIAYFQSHTNTYAPPAQLRGLWEEALSHPGVVGLAISTRPDCLSMEILGLLSEFNQKTFLWVELGLQTIHDDTARRMNRCYETTAYFDAVRNLDALGIRIVTHLILGLPGETTLQMEETVRAVCRRSAGKPLIYGIKFHLFNLVRGSALANTLPDYVPFDTPEDYIRLVSDLLSLVPPEVTIHRLTGDVPRRLLISPEWSFRKRTILNGILAYMNANGIKQGCREFLQPDGHA